MGNENSAVKRYRTAGVIFMISGFIFNPWMITWLKGSSLSITVFTGILLVSFLLLLSGIGLIIRKRDFFFWVGEKYRDFAVIVLNVLILFAIANVFASLLIQKPGAVNPGSSGFFSPQDLLTDSIEFIRKVYPGKNDNDIRELLLPNSPYANHPVLEFQDRMQVSKHYNTGFEGIRFDKKVTRINASEKINGAVWVFGGSTTFGHGVSDNETISACLNRLDTDNIYINFGVHAYHQSAEINKLILLLKKGYQPRKVIFIDGLNDIIRMIETNFHPLETPSLAKSAYTSDYNIATREPGNTILSQLPVARWLKSFIAEDQINDIITGLPWDKYDNVYDPDNLYNTDPKRHFLSTILRSPYSSVDSAGLEYIIWKLTVFYEANYHFLEKLSKAFGFEFSIYYQPIGILSENNLFWRDQHTRGLNPLYRNFKFIVPRIRDQIARWNFPGFYDISAVHDVCPDCYVDLTHYNPELNGKIAEAILMTVQ
ncbi:MAG: hypothetical protein V1775_07095 [Bacteroidota bacterium]